MIAGRYLMHIFRYCLGKSDGFNLGQASGHTNANLYTSILCKVLNLGREDSCSVAIYD